VRFTDVFWPFFSASRCRKRTDELSNQATEANCDSCKGRDRTTARTQPSAAISRVKLTPKRPPCGLERKQLIWCGQERWAAPAQHLADTVTTKYPETRRQVVNTFQLTFGHSVCGLWFKKLRNKSLGKYKSCQIVIVIWAKAKGWAFWYSMLESVFSLSVPTQ